MRDANRPKPPISPIATRRFPAYKVAAHRHTPEIEQTLSKLAGQDATITFVPHLLPVNRGILSTIYAHLKDGVTEQQLRDAYEQAYQNEHFVRVMAPGSGGQHQPCALLQLL